ncbi:hypothetical protein [Sanguibacter suaedae]|uniref:Copper chaperone PCu(A)C n=1 Tax=Sanguibacter suaedae TaxID=2795737 RepID=A0A934IAT7_9MICO|nr:hypothetical protein [Sanguibacter suaedae]MBI9114518.1 hypothetical protein [Sanguibacter suaedae]
MIPQPSVPRPVVALGALGLALSLSACTTITTDAPYAASDGIRASVGDVEVLNLMVVTSEEGAAGQLLGAATGARSAATTLDISTPDGAVGIPLSIEAGETVNFALEDASLTRIESVPVPPGANLEVTLTDGEGRTSVVQVPVLDGTLPEYTDLVPTDDTL